MHHFCTRSVGYFDNNMRFAAIILLLLALFGLCRSEFVSPLALVGIGWGAGRDMTAKDLNERENPARKRPEWALFKKQYGKTFFDVVDEEFHARIFEEAEQRIREHNEAFKSSETTFTVGINQFSDFTEKEWLERNPMLPMEDNHKQFIGAILHNETEGYIQRQKMATRRPASVDWRGAGIVNRVKDQGQCGSCYAFSAVATLESHYAKKYGKRMDLSEQQLVDCSRAYGNLGCNGGWMDSCYQYIRDKGGINQQYTYPYQAAEGSCRYQSNDARVKVTSYVFIPEHDENALADAVANVGPVAVPFDSRTREFMSYYGGIYYSPSCNPDQTTHAVEAIGYGTENGVDYWTLKNSWGGGWGEGGFFRMKRNIHDQCAIARYSSYPIVA